MSSTIYEPVRIPPSATPARVAKVLSGRGDAAGSGIWVGIFAITMSFAAFTSALFVRQGSAADWTHIALPPILYANTLALLLSSATLQMARRAVAPSPSIEPRALRTMEPRAIRTLGWLIATLALGFVFVAGQYQAWRQLAAQGLYLATSPNSSFYYVMTAMHGLHVLAGIAALIFVLGRIVAGRTPFRKSTFEATATYWHFMGVLWLYVLLVLRTKL
jgi:cytochrome c oxidase subunit 3